MVDYFQTHADLAENVFEREGCPIHYWLGGPENSPLIVLMHGANMDHRMFNDSQDNPSYTNERLLEFLDQHA